MKANEFGTSKHKYPKYNLLIENYNLKKDVLLLPWKSIVNTDLHFYCGGVHTWGMDDTNILEQNEITINHYICKSENEFIRKKKEREKSINEIVIKNIFKKNFDSHVKDHEFYDNLKKFNSYNTLCNNINEYIPLIKSEINKYYYGNNYTPSNLSINKIIDYLIDNKIDYFIINSSLLGAFRNNFLLPNNFLIELCINEKNKRDINVLNEKISITYYSNINKDSIKIGNLFIENEIVFPINKIKLNNVLVNCPLNIYKFLIKTGYNLNN